MMNQTHCVKIKKLKYILYSATYLTAFTPDSFAGAVSTLSNGGTILNQNSTFTSSNPLTLSGSGTTIFSCNGISIFSSNANIIKLSEGTAEAITSTSFGSGTIIFSNGTTFAGGNSQGYPTANNRSNASALTISNPFQVDVSSANSTGTFTTYGYVINSNSPSSVPTKQAYQAYTLSGPITKYSTGAYTNPATVIFDSKGYSISLTGNSTSGNTIENWTLNNSAILLIGSTTALPSTFTQLTLFSGSTLETQVDAIDIEPTSGIYLADGDASLSVDDTYTTTLGGTITANSSTYTLNKNGTGTLILTGTNSGGVGPYPILSLNAGIVNISSSTNLPPHVVLGYGALYFSNPMTLLTTFDDIIGNTIFSSSGSNTITLSSVLPIPSQNNYTLTFNGGIYDLNSNDHSANTQLTFIVDSSTTLIARTANDVPPTNDTSGLILNGGTFSANNGSNQPISLTATSLDIAASSTINVASGQILTLYNDFANSQSASNCTLTKTSAGTLQLNASTFTDSPSVSGLQINEGTVAFNNPLQVPGATSNAALTLNGGTLQYNGNAAATLGNSLSLSANSAISNTSNAALTISQPISGTSDTKVLTITSSGTGSVVLTNSNNGTDTQSSLTIGTGIVSIASESNLPNKSATLNGGILAVTDNITLSKALALSSNSTVSIATGKTLTHSQVLNSGNTLSVLGAGTFQFASGVNNSSSNTALSIGNATNATNFSVNNANHLPNATVTLNNAALYITASVDTTGKNPQITLGGNSIINVGSSYVFTLDAAPSGAKQINKMGTGKLIFTSNATNTVTGQTLKVTAGTAEFASGASLPGNNAGIITLSSGTLRASDTTSVAQSLFLTSNSTLDIASSKTLALTGNISSSNSNTTLSVTNGTLNLSGGKSNPQSTTKFNISSAALQTDNTQIPSGSGANLTLSNSSSWSHNTNATTYTNDVLVDNSTHTLTTNANLTLNSLKSASSGGTITKNGSSSLILPNTNLYSGALNVNAGTVELQKSSALANISALSVADSATLVLNFNDSTNLSTGSSITTGNSTFFVAQEATVTSLLSPTSNSKTLIFSGNSGKTLTLGNNTQYNSPCNMAIQSIIFCIDSVNFLPSKSNTVITISNSGTLKNTSSVRLKTPLIIA